MPTIWWYPFHFVIRKVKIHNFVMEIKVMLRYNENGSGISDLMEVPKV